MTEFKPDSSEPLAVEQVTWFEDRIVFEVIREEADEDVVEWERVLSRTENGDFNQTHFNDNVKAMHNAAYKMSTRHEDRMGHRERRVRKQQRAGGSR
jgi:hypothetical protein